jgi:hypothetical protein
VAACVQSVFATGVPQGTVLGLFLDPLSVMHK